MERVEAAYQAGVADAERDIAAGRPRLRYGARGAWGEDLERTLRLLGCPSVAALNGTYVSVPREWNS